MTTAAPWASRLALITALTLSARPGPALAEEAPGRAGCVACHEQLQPRLVADWRASAHARVEVGCDACHGKAHARADDAASALHPTVQTCRRCHELQVAQFRAGDHAHAWEALEVLPTFHHIAGPKAGGTARCAGCHKIGLPTPERAAALRQAGVRYGLGSCDACHTRHTFAASEAREPEACKGCHGDLQYEAWAQSKHGSRHAAKGAGKLAPGSAAPTCQACHLQNGDHTVRAPLGSVALRLPLEEDQAWAADKQALLQGLGVLDAAGGNGVRGAAFEEARIAELDRLGFQSGRDRLTQACRQCHAVEFAKEQLAQRDALIRDADALVAGALREVAALYRDGVLARKGPGPFPDLVKWPTGSAPEQRLGLMFFDHRARLMAHAFHMSPQATQWMGQLEEDATMVARLCQELREKEGKKR
jgi:hypothetical protein